jgi:hypothetical protein
MYDATDCGNVSLQQWIASGLEARSVPRRVGAFAAKFWIEGVVFALLAAAVAVPLGLAATLLTPDATVPGLVAAWVATVLVLFRRGWCFLTATP